MSSAAGSGVAEPLRLRVGEEAAEALHDLRGPLTVIRGQCFTLRRGERRPERRRRLTLIEGEVDRLSRALDRLLAAPGSVGAAPATVALPALVAGVAERHQGAAARAGVRVASVLPGRALRVPGDAELLCRALDNLVQNAIRHSPAGGQVRLALSARDGEAHVRVRDQGDGVHPDDRERIFRPGERGRAPRGAGRGLGLAIARQIAEAHGGRLVVDPIGPGAAFRLSLPLEGASAPTPGREAA